MSDHPCGPIHRAGRQVTDSGSLGTVLQCQDHCQEGIPVNPAGRPGCRCTNVRHLRQPKATSPRVDLFPHLCVKAQADSHSEHGKGVCVHVHTR